MAAKELPKSPTRALSNAEKDWRYVANIMRAFGQRHGSYCSVQYPVVQNGELPPPDPNGISLNIWNNWLEIAHNRAFVTGTDSPLRHKKVHSGSSPAANDEKISENLWRASTNWHLRVIDKIMLGIEDRATDIIVTALDKESLDRATRERFMQKARIVAAENPQLKMQSEAMGVPMKIPAGHPQDLMEWQLFAGEDIKDAAAMTTELALAHCNVVDRYMDIVRPAMARELLTTGIVVLATVPDANGMPVTKVIPLEEAILLPTKDNWARPRVMGFYEDLSYEDVIERTGDFSDKQLARIRKLCSDRSTGGMSWVGNTPKPDLLGTVRVMTLFFMDTNKLTTGEGPDGFRRPIDPSEEGEYSNVKARYYEVCYQGSMIMENWAMPSWDEETINDEEKGPLCWGCGHAAGSQRMKSALGRVRMPMVARALRMNNMVVKAPAAVARAHYEPINALAYKIYDMVHAIRKPGLKFNPDDLIGFRNPDGTTMSQMDILKLYIDENILMVNDVVADTDQSVRRRGDGVQPLDARIGPIGDLMEILRGMLSLFEMAMGFNDASVGNTVGERTAARNMQAMQMATDRSQEPLHKVQDFVETEACLSRYGVLQDLVKSGRNVEIPQRLMGPAGTQIIKFTADIDPGDIGLRLQVRMSEAERQAIIDSLGQDKAAGLITSDEFIEAVNTPNLKQMMVRLKYRRDKREEAAQRNKLESQKLDQEKVTMANEGQAKIAAQSLASEQQFKQALAQQEHEREMEKLQAMSDSKIDAIREQAREDREALSMTIDAKFAELLEKMSADKRLADDANAVRRDTVEDTNDTALKIAEKNAAAKPKTKTD